jgi:hypothetical protein
MGFQLGCLYEPPLSGGDASYLRYLRRLLNSPPRLLSRPARNEDGSTGQPFYSAADLDLLLYWEPERPFWQRWLGITPASQVINRTSASVLVVRRPRRPLRRVLLILRIHKADAAAIQWLGRFARKANLDLFILPFIPSLPGMYSQGRISLQPEVVLAGNTPSGAELRHLASLCANWNIRSTLLLHDSAPQERIEWAITASDCDLVILSDEPYHWLHRRYWGELLKTVLRQCDRPVLIAKEGAVHGT